MPAFSRVMQHEQNQQAHCCPGNRSSQKERNVEEKPAGKLSFSPLLSTGVV